VKRSDADDPTVVAVNCPPDVPGGVHSHPIKPGSDVHSHPIKPRGRAGADEPTLVEVPDAAPDLAHVQPGEATAVDAAPLPAGTGVTTVKR